MKLKDSQRIRLIITNICLQATLLWTQMQMYKINWSELDLTYIIVQSAKRNGFDMLNNIVNEWG